MDRPPPTSGIGLEKIPRLTVDNVMLPEFRDRRLGSGKYRVLKTQEALNEIYKKKIKTTIAGVSKKPQILDIWYKPQVVRLADLDSPVKLLEFLYGTLLENETDDLNPNAGRDIDRDEVADVAVITCAFYYDNSNDPTRVGEYFEIMWKHNKPTRMQLTGKKNLDLYCLNNHLTDEDKEIIKKALKGPTKKAKRANEPDGNNGEGTNADGPKSKKVCLGPRAPIGRSIVTRSIASRGEDGSKPTSSRASVSSSLDKEKKKVTGDLQVSQVAPPANSTGSITEPPAVAQVPAPSAPPMPPVAVPQNVQVVLEFPDGTTIGMLENRLRDIFRLIN